MNEALMITHILISWIALIGTLACGVFVIGLRNSTHQVQYVPIDPYADDTAIAKELDEEHERHEENML